MEKSEKIPLSKNLRDSNYEKGSKHVYEVDAPYIYFLLNEKAVTLNRVDLLLL